MEIVEPFIEQENATKCPNVPHYQVQRSIKVYQENWDNRSKSVNFPTMVIVIKLAIIDK